MPINTSQSSHVQPFSMEMGSETWQALPLEEQSWIAHVQRTMPRDGEGFLAREHFWALSDELSISRNVGSILCTEACFPVYGDNPYQVKQTPMKQPEELGLVVATRQEVGLPRSPKSMPTSTRSERVLKHVEWEEYRQAVIGRVVQVQGLLDFSKRADRTKIFTVKGEDAYRIIAPLISKLTGVTIDTLPPPVKKQDSSPRRASRKYGPYHRATM